MEFLKKEREQKQERRLRYEAPAVIYETVITTRAGSPIGPNSDPSGVDPADLFGS